MQDLTIAPKDGFPNDQLKQAYSAGWYTTTATLPSEAGPCTIRYPDGSTADVPVQSAIESFRAIDLGDPGPGGVALEVTGAKGGTATIRTSRGEAEVPVWFFTIKGMSQPVARVSVAPEAIKPLPTPPTLGPVDPSAHFVIAQDLTAVSGSAIDYRLGVGACDKEITPLVWESADIIMIGGSIQPPPPDMSCTAQLVLHPVKVTTKDPVGSRMILDAVTGNPVLLTNR